MPAVSVLYVEDDPGFARLVAKFLSRSGFVTVNAATIAQGLQIARSGSATFDVILLDHRLPDGDGLDFLAAWGDEGGKIPVVYITAADETSVAVAALKSGATDYVTKDVADEFLELLLSSLNSALAIAELQRDKEAAEQEIREARDRAELLLQEVNHRVSNSLALVVALLRMQSQDEPLLKEALEETQARITAIADIHRSLCMSRDVKHVQIDAYLASLIGDLENAISASAPSSLILLQAERLDCAVDKAISIGMLITELVTNALKYAYPKGHAGEVRVKLLRTHEQGREVRLVVEDDGVGWRYGQAARGTGLGKRVIEMMAASLNTRLELEPVVKGTRAVVQFEL
jgi:two-component sensor histidine kinase/CheY-like chemotaxis protein